MVTTPPLETKTVVLNPEAFATISPSTNSPAIVSMAAQKFRIPADQVALASKDLPEDQRIALRWLQGYCHARQLDKDGMSNLLKKPNGSFYDYDSIYQTLTGRRESATSIANMVAAIVALRKTIEGVTTGSFIETRLSKCIFAVCDDSRRRNKMSVISGDSHIGKTRSLREYTRTHNHGETLYADIPSSCGFQAFQSVVLSTLPGMKEKMGQRELRRRLFNAIDNRMLIIFDNTHRALRATNTRCLNIFDFIQELHEATGCGIVFSMTNEGNTELRSGRNAKRLEQIKRRLLTTLQLPDVTPEDDLALFAASYGLPAAPDEKQTVEVTYHDTKGKKKKEDFTENPYLLQQRINTRDGLGVWLTLLKSADEIAKSAKRPIEWSAVITAFCRARAASDALL